MVHAVKRFLAASAVLIASISASYAQSCTGQFGAGRVCGNAGSSTGLPGATLLSPLLDQNFGSGQGSLLVRKSTGWDDSLTSSPTGIYSLNSTALPSALTGTVINFGQADSANARVQINAFGGSTFVSGVAYGGTNAAPTQVLSGTAVAGLEGYAYNGSAVVGPIATLKLSAAENISSGHQGSKACLGTTPLASATIADGLCQQPSSGVTVGGVTDPGSGFINVSGGYQVNGSSIVPTPPTGTSGGIPYFNTTTSLASSALLNQNQIVLGGGVGTAPATLGSNGNLGQVLRSGGGTAAPAFSTTTFPDTVTNQAILYGSSANVIGSLGVLSGAIPNYNGSGTLANTRTPVLGVAGTAVGSIGFQNLSSGTVTIQPNTGALGSNTWTLRAATDNFVGAATTDTFTNKTFNTASTGNTLQINGNTVNAVTGTGSTVVLQNSPSLVTPALGVASATSLAIGGCTIGADALCATGNATFSGTSTGAAFIPTSATVPTNGMYLPFANILGFATGGVSRVQINNTQLFAAVHILASNTDGPALWNVASTATTPTFSPDKADFSTGIGAQATGNMSMVVGGGEKGRWTSTGLNNANIGQTTPGLGTFTTVSASTYSNLPVVSDASGSPSTTAGIMKCDGTTVTCSSGVVTAVGAVASSIDIGTTTIANGTDGTILYQNGASPGGTIGEKAVTGTGNVVLATSPSLTTPTLGVASATSINKVVITAPATSATLTIADGKTATVSNTLTFTGTDSSSVAFGTGGTVVYKIASGTKALATSAISSGACTSAQTATATGTTTSDVVDASFASDPTAVTGYSPTTNGMLTIISYPTADTVNFKVCNNTSSSITPGAISLNWKVTR